MLVTNQRLDKLAAARVDFVNRGMLDPAYRPPGMGLPPAIEGKNRSKVGDEEEDEEEDGAGPTGTTEVVMVTGNVTLARSRSMSFVFFG
jgi:hypothetical protein